MKDVSTCAIVYSFKHLPMSQESFPIKRWTMMHSFFAGMGGYAIDTHPKSPDDSEFICGSPRITLTDDGVLFLARYGCLPDLSTETIIDKSKADPIAKSLVCIQAG